MVKNRIKVCARIKGGKQPKCKVKYCIEKEDCHEMLCLETPESSRNCCRRGGWCKFRFSNVFDINAKQEQIFGVIAQPIINSFVNGFNGTIFAYGQTGSGKTYTITGSPEDYNERGIIPRSIEQVFRFTSKCCDKCCVGISYMEIYNEIGYDLLESKHQAYCFEQLPKIVLLEDSKGEIHLRNLSVHNVSSVKEAMRLLFLGDTNRTIAETPSNEISSRSHCIFTIYLSYWVGGTGKIRRSKLNLVDLAGSERINKTNVTGVTLMEAKSINLSLYYLEQVILALSEAKRSHVPYRNSIMTNILKDSLGGNCFTLMLATVTIGHYNFEETLSTCKFSQRVAMVSTDAYINEEFDPYQEISELSKEVENLRNHLKLQSRFYQDTNTALTDDEISKCKQIVKGLIDSESCPTIEPNMKIIQHCFNLLKGEICHLKANLKSQTEKSKPSCDYENVIKCKDKEIERLNTLLKNAESTEKGSNCKSAPYPNSEESPPITCADMDTKPRRSKEELRIFRIQDDLHKKYDIAKSIVPLIEQCQRNIIMIRKRIDSNQLPDDIAQNLLKELQHQQDIYRESLMQLQNIKAQVEHLEHGLQQAEFVMGGKLKRWVGKSTSEITSKDILQIEDTISNRSKSIGSTCKSVTVSTNDMKEIGLQTVEDSITSYPNHRPSTSNGYSRNSSNDATKQSFNMDCDKVCERSRSAKCIRNEGLLRPLNPINDCMPQSEICLGTTNCYTTSDNPIVINKSIIESREGSPCSSGCLKKSRSSFKSCRSILPLESEKVACNKKPFRSCCRNVPPVILNSFTDTRKSSEECREISHKNSHCANRGSNRESRKIPPVILGSFTNTRKSFKEPAEVSPSISDCCTKARRSYVEPKRAPSLCSDSLTQIRKPCMESIQIPACSNSFKNVRKTCNEIRPICCVRNGPVKTHPLYQEIHSQEDLNRNPSNCNSVIDLRKSSKSFQINNDASDNEDTYKPYYCGQGIQSVEERHYHVNSVPCLNVMSGITTHSQNTFISDKVGSFLGGCHFLRSKVPYFDVHVKIDPNKQIKTTTVHQKIVSINPESDDISELLIPPSFFDKSSKPVSEISNHPLQSEKIPKLIKNLAGSLFHKLNKGKSKSISTDGILEIESATSSSKEDTLEGDKVATKKCSCEKLNEPIMKKSPIALADDLNQEFHKTNTECPETKTDCPKETKDRVETFSFFKDSDSKSFIEFIKTVPLTGDRDVDEEIVNFYRTKFQCK